jgi:FMN phosphatase YigB (HAD superfamily)
VNDVAGFPEQMGEADLYPDVRPTLRRLRSMGLWLAAAGNQPAQCGAMLRKLALPVDAVYTSADWGVRKPDLAFFHRLTEVAPHPVTAILYVGDNWNHDVLEPAHLMAIGTVCAALAKERVQLPAPARPGTGCFPRGHRLIRALDLMDASYNDEDPGPDGGVPSA